MKAYRVYFDRNTGIDDYAYFPAENITEAKRRAQEYRRAWNIEEKVARVVEVPQIVTFGRYDNVSIWMRWKGEDLYIRDFDKDARVGEIYDAIQECIRMQDRIAEETHPRDPGARALAGEGRGMMYRAYVPYTLPVTIHAPAGTPRDELVDMAYDAANGLMREDPGEACRSMFSEDDPDFEVWEE